MNQVAMVIQRFRPEFSGHGVQVEDLCRQLAGRGIRSRIVTAVRGRPSDTEECAGYSVRRLRSDLLPGSRHRSALWMPTFAWRVSRDLTRLGRRLGVIHVHAQTDALYGAWWVARRRRIPLIVEMTLMGDDDPLTVLTQRRRLARARARIYRDCDAYVAMSRSFLPSYETAGLPPDRLRVIPQGVDTQRFRPAPPEAKAALRAQLDLGAPGPILAFAGSLIERKGIDVLLQAWAAVSQELPGARLWLVGHDRFPENSAEQAFLARHLAALPESAAAGVLRLGQRQDIERILRAADLFVFPSRREGFGAVIIEAMASGLPAIVADLPGITDFIFRRPTDLRSLDPNADGVVTPQDDAAALAHAILALTRHRAAAAGIGRAGRARVAQRFGFERVTDDYVSLYATLTGSR